MQNMFENVGIWLVGERLSHCTEVSTGGCAGAGSRTLISFGKCRDMAAICSVLAGRRENSVNTPSIIRMAGKCFSERTVFILRKVTRKKCFRS